MDARNSHTYADLLGGAVELGEDLLAAARLLQEAISTPSPSKMNDNLRHIRSLEDASNETARSMLRGLGSGKDSGPLSAMQVTMLLRYLDDAMDSLEETAGFLQAYAIHQRTDQAVRLASFLVRVAEGLLRCVIGLREGRDINHRVWAVAGIEDEADEIYRASLGHLMIFGSDPFHAMRWKDIYDSLEAAIDRCEEAAQFLGGLGVIEATDAGGSGP